MTLFLLRLAAVLAALQCVAHGALFISAKPRHGDAEAAVVLAMKSNVFFAGGLGYWDYYFGYGLIAAAVCLVEAILVWQFADVSVAHPLVVRPMLLVLVAANIGHAALVTRYFRFPIPIAFDLAIAALLFAAATIVSRKPG